MSLIKFTHLICLTDICWMPTTRLVLLRNCEHSNERNTQKSLSSWDLYLGDIERVFKKKGNTDD
jgi:hypothetical protein